MHITFVKKILKNGDPCRKCRQVEERLLNSGYMDHIDDVVIADERDEQSPGMRLARKHAIELAPFFIVQDGDETRIYTVYLKFVKAELDSAAGPKSADAEDILRANPDLDAI